MFLLRTKFPEYYAYQGRKISRKISSKKTKLINNFYDQISIDKDIIQYYLGKNTNKKISIPNGYNKINVEIGFGNGEFLINNAISNPNELFIGIEVYINGIAKALTSIYNLKLKNIILSNLNSFYFLSAMPYKSVDQIFIINPDPWNKKRHNKRRLMSHEMIILLTKIIKSSNSIYMTTDSKTYVEDIANLFFKHKDTIGSYYLSTLSKNDELYAISRYQRKAIEKGRKIYLLVF